MKDKIVVVDYGMGNIHSVVKKIKYLGGDVFVSSDSDEILNADKIILAGVGHHRQAMNNLRKFKLINVLHKVALVQKKPVLGICLGMQLMALKGEEGGSDGLGWINADVKRIRVKDTVKYKVPHMGWNEVTFAGDETDRNPMFKGIPQGSHFYFVHSYRCVPDQKAEVAATANYGVEICAAVARGNVVGTQFHPEKSGEVGLQIYKNFLDLASAQSK